MSMVSGKLAFELFDTYGFPYDLTDLIAREHKLKIDKKEFDKYLEKQRIRSRNSSITSSDEWVIIKKDGQSNFIGYSNLECKSVILKYRQVTIDGQIKYHIVFQETPFYAESGGQIGDSGLVIDVKTSLKICDIFDTQKQNATFFHFAKNFDSDLVIGQNFKIEINQHKRKKLGYFIA
mgnify:CR=1 FL=1